MFVEAKLKNRFKPESFKRTKKARGGTIAFMPDNPKTTATIGFMPDEPNLADDPFWDEFEKFLGIK